MDDLKFLNYLLGRLGEEELQAIQNEIYDSLNKLKSMKEEEELTKLLEENENGKTNN